VALALITLVALGGFDLGVKRSVWKDARALHGGDVIVSSRLPFSPSTTAAIGNLAAEPDITVVRTWQFFSMVRSTDKSGSVLSAVKIVEPGYPLYGDVILRSGKPFKDRLASGTVIVEQTLLDRLGLSVGDDLELGDATLNIVDIVEKEPDRPVNIFSMGPRTFVSAADLDALNLVGKGSRIRFKALIGLSQDDRLSAIIDRLQASAVDREERVEGFLNAQNRLQRFINNFLFFLNLIGIFTLVLAGIGIQASLSAYFLDQEKTIAVMKALGATRRFVRRQFLAVVFSLGVVGSAIGVAGGLLLQTVLPGLFSGFLPADLVFTVSWAAIGEGLLLGLLLTALFALLPLQRLGSIKPSAVLRKEIPAVSRSLRYGLTMGGIGIFIAAILLRRTDDLKTAALMVLIAIGVIFVIAVVTTGFLAGLRRLSIQHIVLRQALKGLFRPRNATRSIVITLTASLSLTAAIFLVEKNLEATFIDAFPPNAPNVFLIDIQPDQQEAITPMLTPETVLYPNIRSRLLAINGTPIDPVKERRRKSDNMARPFNLTYREFLLEDERLISGPSLFQETLGSAQVSVLDTIAQIGKIRIGDRLVFRIQGVPLEATVSSIRTRVREGFRPFFYFVFPEKTLSKAPQTLFTGLRIDPEDIGGFQNRIVQAFPNVSVIDVTQTAETLGTVLGRLSHIIRFFTLFGIAAGVLLIVSSIVATRTARVREAVYFKVLGAKTAFVLKVFLAEHALIAAISAIQAIGIAELTAWMVCRWRFDISYQPHLIYGILLAAGTLVLVSAVGLTVSRSIIRQKPMVILKEQLQETGQ
jgi:putative ABC transport system permease protein